LKLIKIVEGGITGMEKISKEERINWREIFKKSNIIV